MNCRFFLFGKTERVLLAEMAFERPLNLAAKYLQIQDCGGNVKRYKKEENEIYKYKFSQRQKKKRFLKIKLRETNLKAQGHLRGIT